MSDKPKKNWEPEVNSISDLFDNNIVSTYTDAEAIEDGTLVALNKKDRVTRALFDFLVEFAPADARPPADWPVEMLRWFRARDRDDKAIAMAGGLIGKYERQAKKVYEENIGGGIFQVWAVVDTKRAKLNCLLEADPNLGGARKLWLIPNENGGITAMFPEDY